MPRPTTKAALLSLAQENYEKISHLVDGLSDVAVKANYAFAHRDKNVRDTLAHLHHWHLMFLDWYEVGMKGDKPDMPAKGYTFKDTPALNDWIRKQYQEVSLSDIRTRFDKTHQQCMKLIETHSEADLFTKKRYHWTGSTSLASYMISATSSHYDWALKWLRKHQKNQPS